MLNTSNIFNIIQKNDLFVFPLYSVDDNGNCTCGDKHCNSPGKHPYFKFNWKLVATNNKKKINNWCKKYNNINWAVVTGKKSTVTNKYLIVIDIDTKDHELLSKMPKTFGYSTGNGFHLWYWSDSPVKSSVSLIAEKVDIRGMNSYVVIPPSKHVSGRKYKFINGDNCDIVDLPSEFKTKTYKQIKIKKLRSDKKIGFCVLDSLPVASIRKIINGDYRIPEGTRNKTIFRLLCSDRSKGLSKDELRQKSEEYKNKCEKFENISEKELDVLVSSVVKYPPYKNLLHKSQPNIRINFFENYTTSKTNWVSLKTIAEDYNKKYKEELDLYAASNILKKYGYTKRRISKGNVWGIIKKSQNT